MSETPASETTAPAAGRWSSIRFLWINAGALAVVLFIGLAVLDNGYAAHPDEGVYTAQVDALANGSWWAPRPAPDVDRDTFAGPLIDSTVKGDQFVAYDRHALYPLLLVPAYEIAGGTGLLVVSVLGTLAAAIVGAFLARRLDPRYGVAALWLVGAGSPLVFDAYIVVGHSLVAAAAGLTLLGISRAVDDDTWRPLAYAVPAAVATVALRTEGIIYVLSVAAIVGLSSLSPKTRTIAWRTAFRAGALGAAGLTTYLIDTRIARAIGGSSGYGTNPSTLVLSDRTGPVNAIWSSLLRPFNHSWVSANTMVPLVVTLLLVAALAARLMPRRSLFPVAGTVAAAAAALVATTQYRGIFPGLINGLFPAFPVLVVTLVLLGRTDVATPQIRRVLLSSALAAVLLTVSIYDVGGATEWGGRFFHILLVPLAGVTVAVLDRVRQRFPVPEQRVALGGLVVVSLSLSYIAVDWNHARREYHEIVISESVRYAHRQFGDERPLVIVAMLRPDGTSRVFATELDDMDVLVSAGPVHLDRLLGNAVDAGRTKVVIVTEVGAELFKGMVKVPLDRLGWTVVDSYEPTEGYPQLITLGPDDGA